MDLSMQMLSGLIGSEFGVIAMVAGAVFMLALAVMSLFDDTLDPVRSRLKREINAGNGALPDAAVLSEQLRKHNSVFTPTDQPLLQRTAQRLHYGGFHGKNSLMHFYALRMALMITLPLLGLLVAATIPGINSRTVLQVVLIALALGYVGPSFALDKLIANRQKTLRRAFPDALDLLVVCSEAGLSLDAAIQKVAAELGISQPVLAEELDIVIAETRAGIDRHKALQRLVDRTGVEDIKGLVSTLSQSMRFGTGVAETLKVYSEDLRDKRTQAAEEMAAKIGVKLIFPLGVCLLPAFMIVILAPAIVIFKTM